MIYDTTHPSSPPPRIQADQNVYGQIDDTLKVMSIISRGSGKGKQINWK